MGQEEDFILRLAKRMGDVLARALGLAKAGQYEDSMLALEQGVSAELGLSLSHLLRLDPQSAVRLLGKNKASAFAEALRTRSLLFSLAGRKEEARAAAEHAAAVDAANPWGT